MNYQISNFFLRIALVTIATTTIKIGGACAAEPSNNLTVASDKGQLSFLAIGTPGALRVKGEGPGPEGTVNFKSSREASASFTFQLDALKTGIDLRDRHMKEKYLHVEKFPSAKLDVPALALPENWIPRLGSETLEISFEGKLNLHGQTQPVKGTARVKKDSSSQLQIDAQFTAVLSDFGIEIPKYLGVTIAKDVTVDVSTHTPLPQFKN